GQTDGDDQERNQDRGELKRDLRSGISRAQKKLAKRLRRIERDHVPGEHRPARPAFGAVIEPAFDADEDAGYTKSVDEPQYGPQKGLLEQRIGQRTRRQQRDEGRERADMADAAHHLAPAQRADDDSGEI